MHIHLVYLSLAIQSRSLRFTDDQDVLEIVFLGRVFRGLKVLSF